MNNKALLERLTERLPELEWKINSLGARLSANSLPRGLFRPHLEMSAATCIDEIKADIQQLTRQKSEYSAFYLAERIEQKISVLVTLCHLQTTKPKTEEKIRFGLDKISTRQQWLQTLEKEIDLLTLQQQAMLKTLEQIKASGNSQAVLQLQAQLGEVEKRLTLAKETFAGVT
ncbi:MAG: primosomal replication protein [Tatlockia sp.]|nr:primosomal replication protein [Tatlockia sp.]